MVKCFMSGFSRRSANPKSAIFWNIQFNRYQSQSCNSKLETRNHWIASDLT